MSPLQRAMVCAVCLALIAISMSATKAFAQSDPPSRVGRLSDLAGTVYLAPDDTEGAWQPVGINQPVTIGDNVWVSPDGRAEIDFGGGQVRLSGDANVHFSQLDERQFSAYLASGRAILRLRTLDTGEAAKFDTANMQIDVRRPGTYRVDADADGAYSSLVVRDGEVELRVGERTAFVRSGQSAVINGSGPGAALVVRDGYGTDGFDAWSEDRDRRWEGAGLATRYVSPEVPGVRDLDDYGVWDSAPEYGVVWYPRSVAADWVPYRDGQWTYVRPWGWTWVDSAPWGWVPFHYGRWVHVGHRWGWCPGAYVARPVYAPALVAWYGGSGGLSWSANFGGPTFGWVPLAWGEPYWPSYRHSQIYWRVVNRPYAVNLNRVPPRPLPNFSYANARVAGAVTAVTSDVFTGRRAVSGNALRIPPAALSEPAVSTGPVALKPNPRPLAIEAMPRGSVPAPASSLIGRIAGERRLPLRPQDPSIGGVPVGRPAIPVPETGYGSRREDVQVPPSVGGQSRLGEPRPLPGTERPSAGNPPPIMRPVPEPSFTPGRPAVREPMMLPPPRPGTGQSVAAPLQPLPGQNFAAPSQPLPNGQTLAAPPPPVPNARQTLPEPAPRTFTAPARRDSAPVYAPPAQSLPQPQPGMPAPRPAPPAVREPMAVPAPMPLPAAPPPMPAPQVQGRQFLPAPVPGRQPLDQVPPVNSGPGPGRP